MAGARPGLFPFGLSPAQFLAAKLLRSLKHGAEASGLRDLPPPHGGVFLALSRLAQSGPV
jgi:hypothetical protein